VLLVMVESIRGENQEVPICTICQDIVVLPMRLPCKCNAVLCFDEVKDYFTNYGNKCPNCNTKISTGLVRRSGGWHVDTNEWIDRRLWEQIQKAFPDELRQRETGDSTDAKPVVLHHQLPTPGELQQQLLLMQREFDLGKQNEELSNELETIKILKLIDPVAAAELDQQASDAAMARALQIQINEEAHQDAKRHRPEVVDLIDDEPIVIVS